MADPLTSLRTIIELISATATSTGLTVRAHLDQGSYPTSIKVTDTNSPPSPHPHDFHGEWNYTIDAQPDLA